MGLSRRNVIPLYVQVEAALRQRIAQLRPGDPVPSDRALAAEFGVSGMTVRQAVGRLVDEGLLYRAVGRGTFVASPRMEKDMSGLTSFSEDMRRRGLRPSSHVLECTIQPASAEAAEALRLATDSPVVVIRRVRFADEIPMALERVALSALSFPGLVDEDFTTQSLYEILEHRYHARLMVARGTLSATAATALEGRLLGIRPGTPLIIVRRVAFNERNEPVEYGESRYRSDRYSVPIELRRPPRLDIAGLLSDVSTNVSRA